MTREDAMMIVLNAIDSEIRHVETTVLMRQGGTISSVNEMRNTVRQIDERTAQLLEARDMVIEIMGKQP